MVRLRLSLRHKVRLRHMVKLILYEIASSLVQMVTSSVRGDVVTIWGSGKVWSIRSRSFARYL